MHKERLYITVLAAIQFTHILDFVVMMPLGPTLMEAFQINSSQFGALVSSYNYAAAFSGICFSSIADRFDRKRLLLLAVFGLTIGTAFCAFSNSFSTLLTARIITGAFGGLLNGIIFAIVTDLIPFQRRGKAMGVVMSSFSLASVLGIPIGLALADYFGWQATFFFLVSLAIIMLLASVMVFPQMPSKHDNIQLLDILKSYGQLFTNRLYLQAYLLIMIMAFNTFILIPFLSPYAVKNIGVETTDLKWAYLIAGACTVLTARYFGGLTDRLGPKRVYLGVASGSIIPILWFTNSPPMPVWGYILLSCLFMTLVSGRMIPAMTLISKAPHEKDRGSFMGLQSALRAFASATSTLIGGLIISESPSGKLENYNVSGAISVALIFLTMFLVLRLERVFLRKVPGDYDSSPAHT